MNSISKESRKGVHSCGKGSVSAGPESNVTEYGGPFLERITHQIELYAQCITGMTCLQDYFLNFGKWMQTQSLHKKAAGRPGGSHNIGR